MKHTKSSTPIIFLMTIFLTNSYFSCTYARERKLPFPLDYAQSVLVNPEKNKIRTVLFTPDDKVKRVLLGMIECEKKGIKLAQYRLTDKEIALAILDAHKRGVKIEIIIDATCFTDRYQQVADLIAAGIPVYIYNQAYSIMHNKFFVFEQNFLDKALIWTGSANATAAGTTKNRENVIILDSYSVIKQYLVEFNTIKEKIVADNKKAMAHKPVKKNTVLASAPKRLKLMPVSQRIMQSSIF